jgi:GR25 family glycosyltransferase involved in LPS biosynthesis
MDDTAQTTRLRTPHRTYGARPPQAELLTKTLEPIDAPSPEVLAAKLAPPVGAQLLASALTQETIDAIAERVVARLAPLLGEQAADVVSAMDRWFLALNSRPSEIGRAREGEVAKPSGFLPADGVRTEPVAVGAAPQGAPPATRQESAAEAMPVPAQTDRPAAAKPQSIPAGIAASAGELLTIQTAQPAPAARPMGTILFESGWHGWVAYQSAELQPRGSIEIQQKDGTAGILSPLFALSGGGLYRVSVTLASEPPAGARLRLRVTDPHDEWAGPEFDLDKATLTADFFVAHRVPALKIFLLSHAPKPGLRFTVVNAALEKLDAEQYFLAHRPGLVEPAIASMASIPSRREMMRDAVESLLLQCDRVRVFLNEYPDVPDFLDHPRIEIRRSQDYDDKGDAGKFGWIDNDDPPGYRVIVDDDLLFPPDFVRHMASALARYGNHAIGGLHGVLLKQPVTHYYDPGSRSALHFQSAIKTDRTVHVLGTNAVVYHSSVVHLRWNDFMFRNMADIFLARYAQEHQIPMVAINRQWRWVRQNTQARPFETIYENSLKQSRSKFDSSLVQDSIVKYIAPLTLQATIRPKVALCLLATEKAALEEAVASWRNTQSADMDWVLLVAAASDDEDLRRAVVELQCSAELHIFALDSATPAERAVEMFVAAAGLGAAMICIALDSVRFEAGHWTGKALERMQPFQPNAIHCVADGDKVSAVAAHGPGQALPVLSVIDPRLLHAEQLRDSLSLSPADVLRLILSGARGRDDTAGAATILGALRHRQDKAAQEILARLKTPREIRRQETTAPELATVNGLMERVLVINLDRRPDRWSQIHDGLERVGIAAERFRAVDGRWEEIADEYNAYCETPLVTVGPPIRQIRSSREFYFDYDSQRARIAYVEGRSQKKAIASAGAWAYLRTWEKILEQALADRTHTLLVFDDDTVFHKDLPDVFAAALSELPDNWLVLQLGTLQYHWEGEWMVPSGRHLYRTNGSAVGSHAVGLRLDVIPFLLDHVKRMELPFDTGALSAATRAFADQCFVITPNVAIQRLGDSDINSSDFQQSRNREEALKTYRWNASDYNF